MKIGFIVLFVFVSIFGCLACLFFCAVGEKYRTKRDNNGLLNSRLITNQHSHSPPAPPPQPIYVQSQPVYVQPQEISRPQYVNESNQY